MNRLKWWMYRLCWKLGMKNIAVFTFLIDRRPLTEAEIQHGQELWERIKPEEQR